MHLETSRLVIRPLEQTDLPSYRKLIGATSETVNDAPAELLFQWYKSGAEAQAILHQPPYGDRAVVLKSSHQLVGTVGLVPCLDFYALIPELAVRAPRNVKVPEIGLFYAIAPEHRRNGYASEAARALIDYAFQFLSVRRVIATTSYHDLASQGVMRRIGMRICKNPHQDPEWLQIVAFLENPCTIAL